MNSAHPDLLNILGFFFIIEAQSSANLSTMRRKSSSDSFVSFPPFIQGSSLDYQLHHIPKGRNQQSIP